MAQAALHVGFEISWHVLVVDSHAMLRLTRTAVSNEGLSLSSASHRLRDDKEVGVDHQTPRRRLERRQDS